MIKSPNGEQTVLTNNEMKPHEMNKNPSDAGSANNQEIHRYSSISPSTTRIPSKNISRIPSDASRQDLQIKNMQTTGSGATTNGGDESTDEHKLLHSSGTHKPLSSIPSGTNEVNLPQGFTGGINSGVMGVQALNTNNNAGMYNLAQQYTNPMSMLAAGMGSTGGGGSLDNVESSPNTVDNEAPQVGKTPGFDPNRLMSSWASTNNFNPGEYNVGQNFISTDEWTKYANQPTGYTGLMQHITQNTMGSNSKKENQEKHTENKFPQEHFQTQGSSLDTYQNSALTAKMNFAPNNMIMPVSNPQMPKLPIKFNFDPDSLNSFTGSFRPGQFAPVPAANVGETDFGTNVIKHHLSGFPDKMLSKHNQQLQNLKKTEYQKSPEIPKFKPSKNAFENVHMGFSPDFFVGPIYQSSKKIPHVSDAQRAKLENRSDHKSVKSKLLVLKRDQNVVSTTSTSRSNLTVQTTTPSASTTTDKTITTPDTSKTTSLVDIGGFNPDEVNRPVMYNPGMSPGMSVESFQNFQYSPQHHRVNSTSTGQTFQFTGMGFYPSEVNNAKMNFDVNSQLGIPGGSSSVSGQTFGGGYDPIKTNILAIQNPFSTNNQTQGPSFTAGKVSGFGSAFIGSFNPNSVNEGMMKDLLNSQANSNSSGNYFGMGMTGFDTSGYGGNFDPSSVNNAVFNPNEVNNIKMHFDPSEMLDKNPGYDTDKALAYKFNPNNINNMQANFQPLFLQNNNVHEPTNSTHDPKTNPYNGANFVPGLLGGGSKNEIPIFNPATVNNAHMNFSPIGVNNLPDMPKNNSKTSNTTNSSDESYSFFNPNDMISNMNNHPAGIMNSVETPNKESRSENAFVPGLLAGGEGIPESDKIERKNEKEQPRSSSLRDI
ncbi:GATA zinc finger domain-containing protein 14-like [Saccostrea cucullata]|uniref:GATA zinc finger domain-containing protein 14-like n=1 Tax=Saccostrea cuccullata TaxID=36930 RepID=UPI002ED39C82